MVQLKPSPAAGIEFSYSLISQIQLPQVYAAAGNENLALTKSHHFDAAYTRMFANDLQLKAGTFYQYLYDVPIEQDASSTFSVINLLEGLSPGDLANKGKGENYGFEVMAEKQFFSKHYFLLGGSYYESNYTAGDGVKRDSRFNGKYTLNFTHGKEWTKPEKRRTIGLNTRVLYLGGLRYAPVDMGESDASYETVYNESGGFSERFKDYFRLDLRLSFRKNKPGYTRTFAVDIQNLTGQQNEAYQYYDFTQQKVVTKFQLGIIPVLVYRIDF
jgi:hypothetical protein